MKLDMIVKKNSSNTTILNKIGYDDKEEFIKYNKDFIVNY